MIIGSDIFIIITAIIMVPYCIYLLYYLMKGGI